MEPMRAFCPVPVAGYQNYTENKQWYDLWSEEWIFWKKNDTFEESGIYNIMSQDIIELVTPSSGEKTYYKILDNAVPCLIVLEHSIMVNGRNIMFWKNNRNILIYILMKNWTHFMLKPILHLFGKQNLASREVWRQFGLWSDFQVLECP